MPPLWRPFLKDSLEAIEKETQEQFPHIRTAIEEGDLLHACEWIKNKYKDSWVDHLRGVFLTPVFAPAPIHSALIALDQRVIFSLNFDDILERCAANVGANAFLTKRYCDNDIAEFLRGDGRYIVKVHGSLNNPDELIFTQGEYAKARAKNAVFYSAFDAALLTHTFLFVGCGYSDPDLALLLENQAFRSTTQNEPPHYFLATKGVHADLKHSLQVNRNLQVVEYDPIDAQYSGLVNELHALNDEIEAARVTLIETMNW